MVKGHYQGHQEQTSPSSMPMRLDGRLAEFGAAAARACFDCTPSASATARAPEQQQHNKMPSMLKIAMAAATAFGVFTAAWPWDKHNPSVDIVHYSQPGCPPDYQLRKKPYDLDGGQCKTFPDWMPPFESFRPFGVVSNLPHALDQYCHLNVYDQPKCVGNYWTNGDVLHEFRQCADVPSRHGRSIMLVCEPFPGSSSKATISTSTIVLKPVSSSTSTTTVSVVLPTSTVTIPAPSSTTTTTVSAVLPMSTITTAAEMTTISMFPVSPPCTHGCN
ncbi:hypothetical protein LTS09_002997 [Friedmanniomyces endolithicus]|nr:hypothetical protein LTS09_002997 [Friedmanniomyces endolithicus]